jgi:hypothetical protein
MWWKSHNKTNLAINADAPYYLINTKRLFRIKEIYISYGYDNKIG